MVKMDHDPSVGDGVTAREDTSDSYELTMIDVTAAAVAVEAGVPADSGTVVSRVKVKLAVLKEWLFPELSVSMTVYVLVSTTCGEYPEVMVVVRRKVDTKSPGAESRGVAVVGRGAITAEQSSAPGQSFVRVMVPVTGEPAAPTERV